MIAADTSTWIAYLDGASSPDTDLLDGALDTKQVVLPPVVYTELLSDPTLGKELRNLFDSLPVLELSESFWQRVGLNRARLLGKGHRARLADCLIAQSCIDHRVPLLTRDGDFRAFEKVSDTLLIGDALLTQRVSKRSRAP